MQALPGYKWLMCTSLLTFWAALARCACPGDGRMHACLRKNRKELSDACRREELLLEQTEAEHIELRPSLLKACADERSIFCKDVRPGSARVFRWVVEVPSLSGCCMDLKHARTPHCYAV